MRLQKIDADYKQRMQKVQQAQSETAALRQMSEQNPVAPGAATQKSGGEAEKGGDEGVILSSLVTVCTSYP